MKQLIIMGVFEKELIAITSARQNVELTLKSEYMFGLLKECKKILKTIDSSYSLSDDMIALIDKLENDMKEKVTKDDFNAEEFVNKICND